MQTYLRHVYGEWHNNFVYRFAALAYLLMPMHDVEALKMMIKADIAPPFGILPWRLRSDHEVSALLLGVPGARTGANFYNGAHFDWSQDTTRDVYQTRAVITTDAHVIRPENLRILPALMPMQYRGGHNSRWVTAPNDLTTGPQVRQPSVIGTISNLRFLRDAAHPLSIANRPPAQIDRVGNDVMEVDPERQWFDGSEYYTKKVYNNVYGLTLQTDLSRSLIVQQATYKQDPTENHIAMRGFHIRWDYKEKHFCRDVNANGHRNDKRLNSPGARAYLNGETSLLPPAQNSMLYLLS